MQLNSNHEVYKLSQAIDWDYLLIEMSKLFSETDIAKCRLMAGLMYLKVMSGESSSEVLSKWLDCPYCRYLCSGSPTSTSEVLPFAPVVLDIWEREMSGAGNDLLIFAMLKTSLIKSDR